jgi:hypothetical protein
MCSVVEELEVELRTRRLRWFGHVAKAEKGSVLKLVDELQVGGTQSTFLVGSDDIGLSSTCRASIKSPTQCWARFGYLRLSFGQDLGARQQCWVYIR